MYFGVMIKTLVLYFVILFIYRIMGKKEIGQLSVIDMIVSILVIEVAAISITENEPILMALLPIALLSCLQFLLGYFSLKSKKLKKFIEGKPSILIKNGKLNFSEMGKLRYSLEDLISQLREKGYQSIEDVSYAILENNGSLSVFEHTAEYPLPLILDGAIDEAVLREIKKDRKWLLSILEAKNLELKDVFYAFYTKQKTFIITRKDLY